MGAGLITSAHDVDVDLSIGYELYALDGIGMGIDRIV